MNITLPTAWPLSWPDSRPRTPGSARKTSQFNVPHNDACAAVFAQIRQLGGSQAVITTDVELRRDGLPYANQKVLDSGAAVYFVYKKRVVCFACDRWDRLACNIQAIVKTVEALRGIARWGTGDMLDVAITGFAALPPPKPKRSWWEVLMVPRDMPLSIVNAVYRELSKTAHPDAGGDRAHWDEISDAITKAREELV